MVLKMAFLYLYDVHAKDRKKFNRVKRRFYYRLNQLFPKRDAWKTKSAILVQNRHTKALDAFFRSYKGSVTVFKAAVESIEELE